MNTKERINEVFKRFNIGLTATEEETQLETQAVLENGTTIHTDGDSFAEGSDVYIINDEGERIPLPEGEYTLQDGAVLTIVEGGKVGKFTPKGEGKEGEDGKGVSDGQPKKGDAPTDDAPASGGGSSSTPSGGGKKKKSSDEKLEEGVPMTAESVRALVNEILDERFPTEEVVEEEMKEETKEEVEEEVVEMSELDKIKELLSASELELTELKASVASEGVKRAVPTKAKPVPVDLKSLSTEERISALFNQFNA